MPSCSGGPFWEANPRLWEFCKKTIEKEMVASGWNRHAKKFNEVRNRKATRLFMKSV